MNKCETCKNIKKLSQDEQIKHIRVCEEVKERAEYAAKLFKSFRK